MKISVVIPVYNLENYIEATLDSVVGQTYQDIEIVVVDDGSSDDSPTILDRYASQHPVVRVIHQQNKGVTTARLTGVKNATGDYIGFVDGDDLIDPDMYERLLVNAVKYDAEISHCGYRLVKSDSIDYFYNTGELLVFNRSDGVKQLLEGSRFEPSLCNKLFHKRLFGDWLLLNPVDTAIKNNEDLLINYFLYSAAEKSVYEDFCPYQYIVRQNSASKQAVNCHILNDPIIVTRTILRTVPRDGALYTAAARLYVIKLIRAATYYGQTENPEIVSVCKSARKELRAFLPQYLKIKNESFRRRFLACFAACLPRGYQLLHDRYLKRQEQ